MRLDELDEPFHRVLHHAALSGEPPPALLASLRAGIAVEPDAARELIEALETLGDRLRGANVLAHDGLRRRVGGRDEAQSDGRRDRGDQQTGARQCWHQGTPHGSTVHGRTRADPAHGV